MKDEGNKEFVIPDFQLPSRGWAYIIGIFGTPSRKFHYFYWENDENLGFCHEHRSLCRKVALNYPLEQLQRGNDESSDNCPDCVFLLQLGRERGNFLLE